MGTTTVQRVCSGAPPLCTVLIELARVLERRIQVGVREHHVTPNQVMALLRIACRPGISRAELARGMQVSPQAVGQLLAPLLGKGLVSRTISGPGMPIELNLTEQGFEVLAVSRAALDDTTEDVLGLFRPNLAHALDGALRHVRTRLDQPADQPLGQR